MNMKEFADALASKDLERYSSWFADDMRIYVPVHEEPLIGKQAACRILPVVFSLFDNFHYADVFPHDKRTRSSFARKSAVFRLKESTMCEQMRTDLLRNLASPCAHLER